MGKYADCGVQKIMCEVLKRVQKTEYAILKELDRICKKHHITYYLGQGTLLGAAKYQGFIPWDDDIDVLIPYDQLQKLIPIFQREAAKRYLITNVTIEPHFPLPWTKIRDTGTLSRPKRYKNIPINWGICIDLFPIYPVSNCRLLRKLEFLNYKIANKLIMAEFTKYEEHHAIWTRILEKVPLRIRHGYLHLAAKLLTLHKKPGTYVLVACKGGKLVKRSAIFGRTQYLPFEDGTYPAPADYHAYLTLQYGDYMAPLPESEQKGHEQIMGEIEWKL